MDIDLTPRKVDLITEPFDVAIRVGEPTDSNLIARQIAKFHCGLYAAPSFFEHAFIPQRPEDI